MRAGAARRGGLYRERAVGTAQAPPRWTRGRQAAAHPSRVRRSHAPRRDRAVSDQHRVRERGRRAHARQAVLPALDHRARLPVPEVQLCCEVKTLSYSPAVLFALACVMAVFNMLAMVKAALRAAHGADIRARLSSHVLVTHMQSMAQSLENIVEPEDLEVFNRISALMMAQWLLYG